MKEAYLIIQTGYEGIEQLNYLTSLPTLAIKRLEQIYEEIDNNSERDPDGWREENNFIAKRHQIQKDKDFYCIQKWNGKKFDCACHLLGVEPSKLMLR